MQKTICPGITRHIATDVYQFCFEPAVSPAHPILCPICTSSFSAGSPAPMASASVSPNSSDGLAVTKKSSFVYTKVYGRTYRRNECGQSLTVS